MHSIFTGSLLPSAVSLIVDASWKALLLLVIASMTTFAVRQSSAALRHRIWCLSFVGLLLLPIFCLVVPRLRVPLLPAGGVAAVDGGREAAHLQSTSQSEIAEGDQADDSLLEMLSQVGPAANDQHSKMSRDANRLARAAAPLPTRVLIQWSLLGLWLLTALALIGRLALQGVTVWRLVARCRPLCDERWNRHLSELGARLRLRQSVRLLECDEAIVPLTCGLLRPVILLPATSRGWNDERLGYVLLHELAHIQRFDIFFQMVARTACSLYWFNPLVWYALARLRVERELACDDCVVAAGESAVGYADQLVEIARCCRSSRYAVGVPMARSSNLEERIVALLDRARSHRLLSRPLSGLLSLAVLLLVVAAAAFQPVARAAGGNPPNLEQRADKAPAGTKAAAQTDRGAKPDAGDAADATDFIRASRARTAKAAKLRISWTQTQPILKGALPRPYPWELQQPPKDAVIPPVDTMLNGTFKVVLSGGKIRYEENTDSFSTHTNAQALQQDVRVWDGRHYFALFTTGFPYPYGEFQPHSHASAVTRERNILPLSVFFRIFDPEMGELLGVNKPHFEPGTTLIAGRTCRTIKVRAPNGVTVELSVDPQRDYLPLAYTIGSEGRPRIHLAFTGLRELPGNVWAPTEWREFIFGNDGNLESEIDGHVTSCELPKQVDDGEFAIKFPTGTWVSDGEGRRQYVIQANGFERTVPKNVGSAKYSWLMNPANNDRSVP
jgi:beta-lactamase regulating signal transducer with metallopeptidase domain